MTSSRDFHFAGQSTGAVPTQNLNAGAIALLLGAIAIPSTLTFYLGDSKFYAARLAVLVLFVPALLQLFAKGRRAVTCDAFTTLACAWMVASPVIAGRDQSLSSALALVLEFWGGYVVARGFIFGRPALEAYVTALKVVVAIAVLVAVLEQVTGRLVLNILIGPLVGMDFGWEPEYRGSLLRATSIFPHPILYGAFCTAAGAVFLYARQWSFVGVSLFGCLLAMSSAPMLVFIIVVAIYCYDAMLKRYTWRWRALTAMIALFFAIIYVVTNHPTSWVIAHLTFDPSTGYFRQATYDRAFYNIGLSPLTGFGLDDVGGQDFFDKASVDSVWLVLALRFGIPVIVLMLLANITSYVGRAGKMQSRDPGDAYLQDLQTGFTLAVWVLMLTGLTVHYWNAMWLFWGICLGIRAGFKENGSAAWSIAAVSPDRSSAGAPIGGQLQLK